MVERLPKDRKFIANKKEGALFVVNLRPGRHKRIVSSIRIKVNKL